MKHIKEFKLNESDSTLTPDQIEAMKDAEEYGYHFDSMDKDHAVIINDETGDKIYVYPDGTDIQGLGVIKSIQGYWVDPAGGTHSPGEEDPASMYETMKHIKEFKL